MCYDRSLFLYALAAAAAAAHTRFATSDGTYNVYCSGVYKSYAGQVRNRLFLRSSIVIICGI